jgi:hypothetical protein
VGRVVIKNQFRVLSEADFENSDAAGNLAQIRVSMDALEDVATDSRRPRGR